jgi:hypothetical protein
VKVEPYRESSKYWHDLWQEERRLSAGSTHVRSRTRYHHAVRRIKRKEEEMLVRKLLEASMNEDFHIIKEMKKVRGGRTECGEDLPQTVCGADDKQSIGNKFK